MNIQSRIFLLGGSLGMLLFYGVHRFYLKVGSPEIQQPTITEENIDVALDAYVNAKKDGLTESDLKEMNKTFSADFGIRVYHRSTDGRFVVTDLTGKEVKVV